METLVHALPGFKMQKKLATYCYQDSAQGWRISAIWSIIWAGW
jgi:hypothetical protein